MKVSKRFDNRKKNLGRSLALAVALLLCVPQSFAGSVVGKYLRKCPTTGYPLPNTQPESLAALGAALASSLIDGVVDAGVTKLKEIVNPAAVSVSGTFHGDGLYGYRAKKAGENSDQVIPHPSLACLVVAVGDIGVGKPTWNLPFPVADPPTVVRELSEKLGLMNAPTFYFEAVRVFSTDHSALTWTPVRFYVGEYLNDSFWAGSSRSYKIEVQLFAAGQASAFASMEFDYNSVSAPYSMDPNRFVNIASGAWVTMPAPSDRFAKGFIKAAIDSTPFDPYSMVIRVTEAPKPYKLAQLFATAIEANKDAIKTEIKSHIPSVAKAAQATATDATSTAITTLLTAYEAAGTACKSASVVSESGKIACLSKTTLVNQARDKAQSACKVAMVDACSVLATLPQLAPDTTVAAAADQTATFGALTEFHSKLSAAEVACKAETVWPEKKKSAQAQFACSIAIDNASASLALLKAACGKSSVASCTSLPALPEIPKQPTQ